MYRFGTPHQQWSTTLKNSKRCFWVRCTLAFILLTISSYFITKLARTSSIFYSCVFIIAIKMQARVENCKNPRGCWLALEFRKWSDWAKRISIQLNKQTKNKMTSLALAGPIVFLHTPRPNGGGATPLAVWPLMELELRQKKRACRALRDAAIDTKI